MVGGAMIGMASLVTGIVLLLEDSTSDSTTTPAATEETSGPADPTEEPTSDPTDEPTDEPIEEPTEDAGNGDTQRALNDLELGDEVTGLLTIGAQWHGALTLSEETVVIVDTRRDVSSIMDMNLTINDSSADEVFYTDSGLDTETASIGQSSDAFAAIQLPPDDYRVTLSATRDTGGDFTMLTYAADALEPGDLAEAEISNDEVAPYALQVAEPGDYTISVTADRLTSAETAYTGVALFDEAGDVQAAEQSSEGVEITASLEPGTYPLVVFETRGSVATLSTVVEQG